MGQLPVLVVPRASRVEPEQTGTQQVARQASRLERAKVLVLVEQRLSRAVLLARVQLATVAQSRSLVARQLQQPVLVARQA